MKTKVIGADRMERWIRAFDRSIESARKQQEQSNHTIRKARERRKNNAKLKRVGRLDSRNNQKNK